MHVDELVKGLIIFSSQAAEYIETHITLRRRRKPMWQTCPLKASIIKYHALRLHVCSWKAMNNLEHIKCTEQNILNLHRRSGSAAKFLERIIKLHGAQFPLGP